MIVVYLPVGSMAYVRETSTPPSAFAPLPSALHANSSLPSLLTI